MICTKFIAKSLLRYENLAFNIKVTIIHYSATKDRQKKHQIKSL